MLVLKNVSKSFDKVKAVDGLSFTIDKGDVTGLLGPNGAGKTTTMRMITSYFFPSSGSITINGRSTQFHTQKTQSQIGYMPENNPLYNDMIVFDYLSMTAKLQGLRKSKIIPRIKEVANSVGIKNKLASNIGELSKGYKQRVGIASALIHNPQVLILDEPTEGLDPNQREDIRKLIKDLSKDKAILISTHVMQEVKAMCNKVVIINDGKLIAQGSPQELAGTKILKIVIEGEKIKESLEKILESKDEKIKIEGKTKAKTVLVYSNRELRPGISKIASKNSWTIWEMQIQDGLEQVFHSIPNKNESK
ncbi:hypothetical protein CO058_01555 [candidate division WWE3 bacterium CG_4_9_14_0_2_um_filter_35_11]|uniref:ABC transporter domain-containing protein n=1 Tax=candidate division WWE3 bacterium CG_4_9_14_0_2_um_filter_35_11 TaxID=1975077 RepID=A0A2M8EMD8_UNCKA|nr:MAG: hypothetical protein COV25_03935 [candidate division WWE3 bacterium CG10_big_fil_rev_8_21_14_0_10_35_32]PJC23847.1 MAG: hypothetical protein CO058_01555 [candidate division WWE3 bacterium CG_4_9_14_0_2_um_filter_35_11]